MYWIFNEKQLNDALLRWSYRQCNSPQDNPQALQRQLIDFLHSDEVRERDMLRGDDRG